jgi:hypothetical protein
VLFRSPADEQDRFDTYLGGQGGLAVGLDLPVSRTLHFTSRAEGYGALLPDFENSLSPAWGASLRVGMATTY